MWRPPSVAARRLHQPDRVGRRRSSDPPPVDGSGPPTGDAVGCRSRRLGCRGPRSAAAERSAGISDSAEPACARHDKAVPERGARRGRRRAWLADDEVWTLEHGLVATAAARTVVDCARHLDRPWSLAVADAAMRRWSLTPTQLRMRLIAARPHRVMPRPVGRRARLCSGGESDRVTGAASCLSPAFRRPSLRCGSGLRAATSE